MAHETYAFQNMADVKPWKTNSSMHSKDLEDVIDVSQICLSGSIGAANFKGSK